MSLSTACTPPHVHHLRAPRLVFAYYITGSVMDAWRHTLRIRIPTRTRTRIRTKGDIAHSHLISQHSTPLTRVYGDLSRCSHVGTGVVNVIIVSTLMMGILHENVMSVQAELVIQLPDSSHFYKNLQYFEFQICFTRKPTTTLLDISNWMSSLLQ